MKTVKKCAIISLVSLGILLGVHNSETLIYAADIPYEKVEPNGTDEKKYGQTKEDAQTTIDEIAGSNKDEMILDMNGLEIFHKQGENMVQIIAGIIWGFSLLTIVAGGFKVAMSEGGDKRSLAQAKIQIIFAGVGLGVSSLTFVIIQLFQEVLS